MQLLSFQKLQDCLNFCPFPQLEKANLNSFKNCYLLFKVMAESFHYCPNTIIFLMSSILLLFLFIFLSELILFSSSLQLYRQFRLYPSPLLLKKGIHHAIALTNPIMAATSLVPPLLIAHVHVGQQLVLTELIVGAK